MPGRGKRKEVHDEKAVKALYAEDKWG